MNVKKACEILLIDSLEDKITVDIVKKKYRLQALRYHPDKNHSADAAEKFQEIHAAYEFLMNRNDFFGDWEEEDTENGYERFLFSFLNELFKNEKGELFNVVFKKIATVCEKKALETLERLDKTTLLKIYDIIKLYKEVLHFSEDFIEKVKEKIASKIANDEYIVLNPILDDLLENRLYKLSVNGFHYAVPLWHHELVYDNSGCDVTVQCWPILEENVEVDEYNDIHVDVEYTMGELWGKEVVYFTLGENRTLPIHTKSLKLMKRQTVVFSKQGISKMNRGDIYDVSKRGDIYLHLEIDYS